MADRPASVRRRKPSETVPRSARVERGQIEVGVRLGPSQTAWLDEQREPGEGRATALRRLAGIPPEKK